MKILVTRFPLESAHGGAEVQTLTLMQGLRNRGHEVSFLGSCPVLLKEAEAMHFPVHKLEIGPPPVSLKHAMSFFWRRKAMQQQLITAFAGSGMVNEVDAVLMLSLSEKLLLTEHAVRTKAKVFWLEHDRVGRWLTMNPFLGMFRRLSTLVTTVVVSELSKRIYLELGWPPESLVSIHNGIDLDRFNGVSVMERPNGDMLHVGCVARLTADKGIDVLLEAVEGLHDVSLTIVGQGRESHYIAGWVENIALRENLSPPRVRLLPYVGDLGSFYRSVDVFALPSKEHDPFGLVVAEAMSQGVPVIVTDQCGIAQSLQSGVNGIIVRAGDAQTLREAIVAMKDAGMRKAMGEEGRRTARHDFAMDAMVQRYESLLIK